MIKAIPILLIAGALLYASKKGLPALGVIKAPGTGAVTGPVTLETVEMLRMQVEVAPPEEKEAAIITYQAASTALTVEAETGVPAAETYARMTDQPGWRETEAARLIAETGTSIEQYEEWVAWDGEDYARARLVTLSKEPAAVPEPTTQTVAQASGSEPAPAPAPAPAPVTEPAPVLEPGIVESGGILWEPTPEGGYRPVGGWTSEDEEPEPAPEPEPEPEPEPVGQEESYDPSTEEWLIY